MREMLPPTPASNLLDLLRKHGTLRSFDCGEMLRQSGHHYREMFLITQGCVAIRLPEDRTDRAILGPGAPIGEISFLLGYPATATVVARSFTETIVIDDATLRRIEREQPALSAQLLRYLAKTARKRMSYNLTQSSRIFGFSRAGAIDVVLCRTDEMLENAKRLRYEVYCRELGRNSPNADHDRKTISDDLDAFGHTFVALENGEAIGTIRGNIAREGPLGALQELYGMELSPCHPQATSVVTKFVVKKSRRGSFASFKLISALTSFGLRNNMKECYIDSVPPLLPYYKAIGFRIVAPQFLHPENGPSYPMKLDLTRYGERLCKEPSALAQTRMYLKAQAIRMFDAMRGALTGAAR